VPDANTIWTFREALTRAQIGGEPAIQVLFRAYEAALTRAGFLAMGGQIIDASIVAAPKQRNSEGEKAEIRAGASQRMGRTSLPSSGRRTGMRAGR
jgi:transposase, IS5 family